MKRLILLGLVAAALGVADSASAFERTLMGAVARRQAQCDSWHGAYANVNYGAPVALVVPPTAEYQTQWGWGVGNTRVVPIRHQFEYGYPGAVMGAGGVPYPFTPAWPSDTTQFGYNYVRGPW